MVYIFLRSTQRTWFLLMLLLMVSCSGQAQKAEPIVAQDSTSAAEKEATAEASKKVMLIFGDSITAGYGLEQEQAFPALLQTKIDSVQAPWKVINGGLSGETTAAGLRRLEWTLQQPVDLLLIELGGNDALRGVSVSEMRSNLDKMIQMTKSKYPDAMIVLAGMKVPPNLGAQYGKEFEAVYAQLAKKHGITLIPFILEGVGGNENLNQADQIHPTAEGHRIIAKTVWEVIEPLL